MTKEETYVTSKEAIQNELVIETKEVVHKIPENNSDKDETDEIQDTSLQQEKRRYNSYISLYRYVNMYEYDKQNFISYL